MRRKTQKKILNEFQRVEAAARPANAEPRESWMGNFALLLPLKCIG
jgi:hypothetical protein